MITEKKEKKNTLNEQHTVQSHRLQRAITYWHVKSAHQGVTYHLARAGVFTMNSVSRAIPGGRGKRPCDKVHYTNCFQTSAYANVSDI